VSKPWLSIIGIGEEGIAGLTPAARLLLQRATLFYGGQRHLALLPDDGRERRPWTSPMTESFAEIGQLRGQTHKVCVLASGDPFCFGVASVLMRYVPFADMMVIPAPSIISLACSRMGWAYSELEVVTLVGRPLETLHPRLYPGARILILSGSGATVPAVARLVTERGYGAARMVVIESLGGVRERRVEGTAAAWADEAIADLNVITLHCPDTTTGEVPLLPRLPGLPDEAYSSDGMLTKREVRAATLAALAPVPGQLLWDVGAGCGSIAIEWLRCHPTCRAIAIEADPDRCAIIIRNAAALGCPSLQVINAAAPEALETLEQPHAVFIGGGLAEAGTEVLSQCWNALPNGGRLVANAVTLEGERRLLEWHGWAGGSLVRIQVSRVEPIGRRSGWRSLAPVTQYVNTKRTSAVLGGRT